jgi:hypothetical protein
LRQAYDYWQDQPGNYRLRGEIFSSSSSSFFIKKKKRKEKRKTPPLRSKWEMISHQLR